MARIDRPSLPSRSKVVAAICPLAPGTFRTTTGRPSNLASGSLSTRASTSLPPPAG